MIAADCSFGGLSQDKHSASAPRPPRGLAPIKSTTKNKKALLLQDSQYIKDIQIIRQ